jgi:hypothetical protein
MGIFIATGNSTYKMEPRRLPKQIHYTTDEDEEDDMSVDQGREGTELQNTLKGILPGRIW